MLENQESFIESQRKPFMKQQEFIEKRLGKKSKERK